MRLYICHICPKDKILDYGFSISASNFNFNLISGGGFDKILSIYPGFSTGDLKLLNEENIETVYCKWRKHRGLRQRLARFVEQISVFRKIPTGADVWFYNVTTLNILLISLLKVFRPSCKLYTILLDFAPDELFHKIALKLINRMSGRICLSTYSRFNSYNSICMPGVIGLTNNGSAPIKTIKKEFIISGALKENITMLSMLLDAFSEMPDLKLHISGVLIDHKEKLYEYSSKFPNIIYHGKLPFDEYNRLLESIPFSLNTRKPTALENQCNFPSKVIEALCHNRIIISTILYPQLNQLKYFHVSSDLDSFKSDIQRIANMPEEELLSYANQGAMVTELYNAERWFENMRKIENIAKTR